ncbi:hypothetical protein EDD18DRAFT_1342970 [Armillaria luteobubalina]|uniref:Uncharacterized protein n=1 Tax=Armillaria luteobubalina TaxID=153913 RepID=A0AA39UWU6_9AGAR|nr:hypothetical protein EDD18DRAFT_1342970 [Armillaria luteobubalina]
MPDELMDCMFAPSYKYRFHGYVKWADLDMSTIKDDCLTLSIPIDIVGPAIPANWLCKILAVHKIPVLQSQRSKADLLAAIDGHDCSPCDDHIVVLKKIPLFMGLPSTHCKPSTHRTSTSYLPRSSKCINVPSPTLFASESPSEYPPPPLDKAQEATIICECVSAMDPSMFQEAGCTVCSQLTPLSSLSKSRHVCHLFGLLENDSCTQIERTDSSEPVRPIPGPICDATTDLICLTCRSDVHKGKVPKCALANNLWIGEVPEVLA